jgi:dienelactone hydrolase
MKKILKVVVVLVLLGLCVYLFLENYISPIDKNYGKVETKLYLGESNNQPLIVGFGGSEGGNAWDSDYWKPTRDEFLKRGYAFLAVAYFGTKNTPSSLDRISLNAIHDCILKVAENPKINKSKIAIIGGSKGGELVLNLASLYDDINAVVAIVPSNVSFPAHTLMSNTSSWMYNDEELPFILPPYATIPVLLKGDRFGVFQMMLDEREAAMKAQIPVENINGNLLLLSATKDEEWPCTTMCDEVVARLRKNKFKNYYEHISIEGGHTEPLKHFDLVYEFLDKYFKCEQY